MTEKRRLPDERDGITHKFSITDRDLKVTDGYLQVGLYPNDPLIDKSLRGRPGEIFLKIGKPGDETAVYDQLAIVWSVALQYGVPLENICNKLMGTRYEPSGHTSNPDIKTCTSITDYVARFLLIKYGQKS